MALRNKFVGRYLRYKTGTSKFVRWLAKTASQYCDLSTRLKCFKTGPGNADSRGPEPLEIQTHELVDLAKVISNATPTIPQEVLILLDDVITGRQTANAFYNAQAIDDQTELTAQNEFHRQFTVALQTIRRLLYAAAKSTPDPRATTDQGIATPATLANLFEYLEVEDTDAVTLTLPAQGPSSKTEHSSAQTKSSTFAVNAVDGNDSFAIWCFLEDFSDIRTHVRQTWEDYRAGNITLEVASVIIETAIGMLERLHKECVALYPRFADWPRMIKFLRLGLAIFDNIVYAWSWDEDATAKQLQSKSNIEEMLAPAAVRLLATWPILIGRLQNTAGRLDGGREPPTWVVMTVALLMDIHEACDQDSGHGAKVLNRTAQDSIRVLDKSVESHRDLCYDPTCKHDDVGTHRARLFATEVAHALAMGEQTLVDNEKDGLRWMLKCAFPGVDCLPHAAGSCSYQLKLTMDETGVLLANDGHAVLLVAHLYKAASKYGICPTWPDMDFLVSQHSGARPFVTKTSASADAFALLRHFLLDLGVDATAFAAGRIPPPPSTSVVKSKARKIDFTCSEFEVALRTRMDQNEKLNMGKGDFDLLETTLIALTTSRQQSPNKRKSRKKIETQSHFTPLQLLDTLRSYLIAEEPRLNFDYVGFSRFCIAMLSQIHAAGVKSRVPLVYTKESHKFVYYLLKTAAEAHATAKPLCTTPFAAAASTLRSFIVEQGKEYSQQAFNQSSGRIPKSHRPQISIPDMTNEKAALQELLPNCSIGTSNRTLEIYDPDGADTDYLRKVMETPQMKAFKLTDSRNMYMFAFCNDEEQEKMRKDPSLFYAIAKELAKQSLVDFDGTVCAAHHLVLQMRTANGAEWVKEYLSKDEWALAMIAKLEEAYKMQIGKDRKQQK